MVICMERTLSVAKELYNRYCEKFKGKMDEMKMHKLMYFVQRESLMYSKEPLFEENFYGWKFGPVLKSVRKEYKEGREFSNVCGDVSDVTKRYVNDILDRYGNVSSWKLSSLSHNEFSWKEAREGLGASENGDVKLSLSAMKVDAARELASRRAV